MNPDLSFPLTGCYTKVKELSLAFYLPLARRRILRQILFPMVQAKYEIQTASSRFWTWVVNFNFYDCNHSVIMIRELSGPNRKFLIPEFLLYPGLVYFIYINIGSNLGPEKISFISGSFIFGYLISGWHCITFQISNSSKWT